MRGSRVGLKYEFGKYGTAFEQIGNRVNIFLSDGSKGTFDLVVGAEDLGSRTQRVVSGEATSKAPVLSSLGVYNCLYNIPRDKEDEDPHWGKAYQSPGRRMMYTRI